MDNNYLKNISKDQYMIVRFSDGIGQYQSILAKEFHQNKLENATQKTQREKMKEFFKSKLD
ncbi:unnamed protein product (macronuclear) [Paramecium tetraurelia]|uniref:Uncharacterized protein n=1 Tax=Paramecium tetraurelia TaxID=5888 RepID=A0ED34_PARTE|nr:uncharacterized protein GSPATT00004070001 [Paramecium tetraurelia]CAK93201.1 unnamed protein product [Paramecium tetraurelia]|eukprot:XP_001460598.1 hypothetical protein (macronuclear) [Paramecium tetraurelia strain d4-2]